MSSSHNNRKTRKNILTRAAAILAILMAGASTGYAGTTWDGDALPGDANWTTAANWDGDSLPAFDGSDAIVIPSTSVAAVTTLNGDKTIGTLLSQSSFNGTFEISGDTLTLNGGSITKTGSGPSSANILLISSDLELGADTTITNVLTNRSELHISGNITETNPGTKATVTTSVHKWTGTNTFTGGIDVDGGAVFYYTETALGSGTINVINASRMWFTGTTGSVIPNNWTISDSYFIINLSPAAVEYAGDVELQNDVTIQTEHNGSVWSGTFTESGGPRKLTFVNNARTSNLAGALEITGGLEVSGNHSLNVNSDNTLLQGDVTIGASTTGGTLILGAGSVNALGQGTLVVYGGGIRGNGQTYNNPVVFNADHDPLATLQFAGTLELAGDVDLQGNMYLRPQDNGANLTLSGNISDGGNGFTLDYSKAINTPASSLTLTGDNSYGGGTTTRRGNLYIGSNTALGTGTLTINDGSAAVRASGGPWELDNAVVVQSAGILAGTLTFNGGMTLDGSQSLNVTGDWTFPTGIGEINGPADLTKIGNGTLRAGEGSYTGSTFINDGVFVALDNRAMGTAASGTSVASGATLAFQGGFDYLGPEAIDVVGLGDGNLGAIRNISGNNSTRSDITMTGATRFGSDADTLTLKGDVLGGFDVTKVGAGRLDFDGATNISNLTVSAGTLGGSPTMTGTLQFDGGTFFALDILAQQQGFEFTQMTAGDVTLSNPTLSIALTTPVAKWQKLFIVVNDGVNPVVGTFNAVPNGTLIQLSPGNFARISYFGDSTTNALTGGNDVVLYDFSTTIPEPATMSLLVLGSLMLSQRRRKV